jgi:acyl-[acyl-carrier-protein]-phospholipid O-acyltransferase/long-chain-fatty-acid--[acyl-carrier-protein] ligase
MAALLKGVIRILLTALYRVRLRGIEHYHAAGPRALIVANHTSYLDAVLLVAFLPDRLTFAVNSHVARRWWVRLGLRFVDFFPLDPANPYSLRGLIRHLRAERRAVIFPEGRITVTGALMKIYHGSGLVADRTNATLLPVRIEGAQYTPFSRQGARSRWLPRITLTFLPPRPLSLPNEARGRERRLLAGRQLADLMAEMMFITSPWRRPLFAALLEAGRVHGGAREIAEDIDRAPVTYRALIARSLILGRALARASAPGERVGLMLPGALATVYALFGLAAHGRVAVLFDPGAASADELRAACRRAAIRTCYTSRRYVRAAHLEALVESLATIVQVRYLEDVRDRLTPFHWLAGYAHGALASLTGDAGRGVASPDSPAVVLFIPAPDGTLGETTFTHASLLAGCRQLAARIPLGTQQSLLSVLPPADPLGLVTGMLLPLVSGARVFLYPAPHHYRIVPEMAYGTNTTMLFATDELLARYAEHAHPYDFQSLRYVFADARYLRETTRRTWAEKFGLRLFEIYGRAGIAPALAVNSPVDYRSGTVGRLMPGLEKRLEPEAGQHNCGRLSVRGPGLSPSGAAPDGWSETGDIVAIDREGYVQLMGRQV